MFNMDQNVQYWVLEESWNFKTKAFPFPRPHHSVLQHFGDTLNTFAPLNIAQGGWGKPFSPKDAWMFQHIFWGL